MEIKIKTKTLRAFFETAKYNKSNTICTFREDSIVAISVDLSHVTMVEAVIPASEYTMSNKDREELVLDFDIMYSYMKTVLADEVRLFVDRHDNVSISYTQNLSEPTAIEVVRNFEPEVKTNIPKKPVVTLTYFKIQAKVFHDLYNIIKKAKSYKPPHYPKRYIYSKEAYNNYVAMTLQENTGADTLAHRCDLVMEAQKGKNKEVRDKIVIRAGVECNTYTISGMSLKSYYDMDYINNIVATMPKKGTITIGLNSSYPISIGWEKEGVQITHLLAPHIGDE